MKSFYPLTEIHFVNERVVFGFEKVDDTCVSVELLLQAGLTERELTLPQVVFKFSSAEWPNSCNTAAIEAGAIHRLSTPTMKTHTHKRRPFSLSFRFKCPTFSLSFSFTHLCVLDVNTRHVDNKQTEPDRWIDRARLLVLGDEQKTKWLTETWRSCWKGVADVAARQRLARRVWENCTQPDHAQTKAVILFFFFLLTNPTSNTNGRIQGLLLLHVLVLLYLFVFFLLLPPSAPPPQALSFFWKRT